jgi:hypothetical protein
MLKKLIDNCHWLQIADNYQNKIISLEELKSNIHLIDLELFLSSIYYEKHFDEELVEFVFETFPDKDLFYFRKGISLSGKISIDLIKKYLNKFLYEDFKSNKRYSDEEQQIIKDLYDNYSDLISDANYSNYSNLRHKRFNVINRAMMKARQEIMAIEDASIFAALDNIVLENNGEIIK